MLGDTFEGIPNRQQWVDLTTPQGGFLRRGRNDPLLAPIDAAVTRFEVFRGRPFNADGSESPGAIKRHRDLRALRLLELATACNEWLGAMTRAKRSYQVTVQILTREAVNRAVELSGVEGATARESAASLNWTMLKEDVRQMVTPGAGRGPTKMLDQGYWLETSVANPHHFRGHDIKTRWEQSRERDFFVFMQKHKHQLERELQGVKYVTEGERWRYNIVFSGDGSVHRRLNQDSFAEGAVVNCVGWIFVIDEHDHCYLNMGDFGQERRGADPGYRFHHSSIPAGKAVRFAGALEVVNGTVTVVDGCSGHYKPTQEHLIRALLVLENNNVDLRPVRVEWLAPVPGQPGMLIPQRARDADAWLNLNRHRA